MRQGMRAALAQDAAIAVVGESGDVASALNRLRETGPDVVIVGTVHNNCAEMVRAIRLSDRSVRVVVLVSLEEPGALLHALRAGSHGLLLRRAPGKTLIEAVVAVRAGGTFVSEEASVILMHNFIRQRNRPGSEDVLPRLSTRERQVLDMTVNGLTSNQIAQQLAISPKSVGTYRGRLMAKIGVRNISALRNFAVEHGLARGAGG